MRYLIEHRDRTYLKGYRSLSFVKNMGKNLSNKYGQTLLDSAEKSTTDAIKSASKGPIQKTTEANGDLIGKKIADKITSVSKKSSAEHSLELHSKNDNANSEIEVRQQIIDGLRLV